MREWEKDEDGRGMDGERGSGGGESVVAGRRLVLVSIAVAMVILGSGAIKQGMQNDGGALGSKTQYHQCKNQGSTNTSTSTNASSNIYYYWY